MSQHQEKEDMKQIIKDLEWAQYKLGIFSRLLLSEEQIRQKYMNVGKQAAFAVCPENKDMLETILMNALFQLRIAEAQRLFYVSCYGTDNFAYECELAKLSINSLIRPTYLMFYFWQN